jgi:enamine deaminase RidA (YjgF/YER057c/UK114 family)
VERSVSTTALSICRLLHCTAGSYRGSGSTNFALIHSFFAFQVLHVKSMSEWAPLCIGPYAQANTIHNSLVFVAGTGLNSVAGVLLRRVTLRASMCFAGQIPLNPATMGLFDPSMAPEDGEYTQLAPLFGVVGADAMAFIAQLALCLRHVHRVLQATGSSISRALLCTVYVNLPALSAAARSGLSDAAVHSIVRGLISTIEASDTERAEGTNNEAPHCDEDDEVSCFHGWGNASCRGADLWCVSFQLGTGGG